MDTPQNSGKQKLNDKNKLMLEGDDHPLDVIENSPRANGDLINADFGDEDQDQKSEALEKKLNAEVDNLIANRSFKEAAEKINRLLLINAANPETLKKKAFCETKLEKFTDAMLSLQTAADLDSKMECCLTSYEEYKKNKQILIKSNDI